MKVGQSAKVKIAAYPFQKYGLVDGVVVRVSPDASETSRSPEESTADGQLNVSFSYRVRVRLDQQQLSYQGVTLPLSSGMQATADIRLGDRSVIEYLLAPVQRAWHEAGRER